MTTGTRSSMVELVLGVVIGAGFVLGGTAFERGEPAMGVLAVVIGIGALVVLLLVH